jgi:hypothetical protein
MSSRRPEKILQGLCSVRMHDLPKKVFGCPLQTERAFFFRWIHLLEVCDARRKFNEESEEGCSPARSVAGERSPVADARRMPEARRRQLASGGAHSGKGPQVPGGFAERTPAELGVAAEDRQSARAGHGPKQRRQAR